VKMEYQDVYPESRIMITPMDVVEYIFCPRFIYFMYCLGIPQHEELRWNVLKGRQMHESKNKENKYYLRRRIGCIKKEMNVYLASEKLHIRGEVDEVLHLEDGTLAPLDYKLTEYKEFTYREGVYCVCGKRGTFEGNCV